MFYFTEYIIITAMKSSKEIDTFLRNILRQYVPPLKIRTNTEGSFEVAGTKETMQGKLKVDGFYFASVVPKEKDVRLYYFPIYTHATDFNITDNLKKCLKGKSCFHFKKLDESLEKEISEMVKKGISIYKKEGLV